MEFSLIENGADSLKKTKIAIESFDILEESTSYHHIKDATIFLNNGIEVLLKFMLTRENESLIFADIKKYTEAKKELHHKYSGPVPVKGGFGFYPNSMYTVFDVPKGRDLQTIGLSEAIDRVRYFCDIYMPEDFVGAIYYINNFRNKLTHHSVKLHSSTETEEYIAKLKFLYEESLKFFDKYIQGILKLIDQQRFELTKEEALQHQRDMEEYYQERAMSRLSIDEDEL